MYFNRAIIRNLLKMSFLCVVKIDAHFAYVSVTHFTVIVLQQCCFRVDLHTHAVLVFVQVIRLTSFPSRDFSNGEYKSARNFSVNKNLASLRTNLLVEQKPKLSSHPSSVADVQNKSGRILPSGTYFYFPSLCLFNTNF
jgi:hypothetical protein